MDKIAALIDFTPTTDVVVDFAKNLALQKHAHVFLVTVVDQSDEKALNEANEKMMPFCKTLKQAGINCTIEIATGPFFDVIASFLDKLHADLAIIGTHGKRGLRQNIFGSFILKLVKSLQIPSLVVQNQSTWPNGGFKNVFFPIASHSRFEMKIEQTEAVMAKDGIVSLYAIYKTDMLDDRLKKNIALSEELFKQKNLNFKVIEEDVQLYSVGYSRQSLVYADAHKMQLISVMAQVSNENKFFGNANKENIILNPTGIPVLCCNDEDVHF